MPKFSAKFTTFSLDKGRFSKTLDDDIRRQMRQAARAFVRVAAASVPFRTGFARGTFRNILEATGQTAPDRNPGGAVFQAIRAFRTISTGLDKSSALGSNLPGRREYYQKRIQKTPQSGRQFATQPSQIFKTDGFVYEFNFEVFITYFNINDFVANPRTPSSPWKSFERGRATFLNYIKTIALQRIANINSFLVEHEINVTGSTVVRKQLGVIDRSTRIRG